MIASEALVILGEGGKRERKRDTKDRSCLPLILSETRSHDVRVMSSGLRRVGLETKRQQD